MLLVDSVVLVLVVSMLCECWLLMLVVSMLVVDVFV